MFYFIVLYMCIYENVNVNISKYHYKSKKARNKKGLLFYIFEYNHCTSFYTIQKHDAT